MEYINEFMIRGKIIAINEGNHPSIRLFSKSGNKETYPLILVSSKMLKNGDFKVKQHVEVSGSVLSIYARQQDGSFRRRQFLKAKKVELDKTMCEERFSVKGRFNNEFKTVVCLQGEFVSENIRNDDWMSIVIKTSEHDMDVVKVQMKKIKNQPSFKKGDPISVVASLSTVNKQFGDKKYHFENIVVNDISAK